MAGIVAAVTDQLAPDGPGGTSAPAGRADAAAHGSGQPLDVHDTVPDPVPAVGRGRRERVSKWDRPPDPHDWRYFVGTLGKVLIATGLLMFGFVAYQLWGTGIETARAQRALKSEFRELVAERSPAENETATPTTDVAVTALDEPGPDDTVSSPTLPGADDVGGDGSPIVPTVEPVAQNIPPIVRGEPLALLEIPAIGRSDIVVPGVSLNDLKDGPGHYPDTPLPGQLGNAAIAGHRTTYGAPFFDVDQLRPGDELIVTMITGDQFVYEVTGSEIVSASDYWVIATSDPTIATLTLTSCHPKYTARDRIVIHSVLNPAKSATVGFPTAPYELADAGDAQQAEGDDPVVTLDDGSAAQGEPPSSVVAGPTDTVGSGSVARDEPDVIAAPGGDDVAPPAIDEPVVDEADAFSQGWFADRSAFVQIALWGTALILISLAAYAISRRFRRDSIGFLVGIAPFLFALYFFFQNVNRLLPPGL